MRPPFELAAPAAVEPCVLHPNRARARARVIGLGLGLGLVGAEVGVQGRNTWH